jgi:3-keto-disaccharide hydrolase
MGTRRKICWLGLFLTLAGYGMPQVYAQEITKKPAARQTGFKSIFNGKDLTGWDGDPAYWTVEDGAITGTTDGKLKANSFIVWRGGTVKNFELRVKVKITQGGNSGLQYRSVPFPNAGPYVLTGYQCDIVTTNDEYDGMLYDERGRRILAQSGTRVVIDPSNEKWIVGTVGQIKHFPAGEWHEYQVIVRGNHHLHRIDGHTTVEVFDHDPKGRRLEGLLGVQVHVGPAMKVQFKDWRLKDLPEAPLIPPEKTPIPPNAPKVPVQGAPQRKP